MENKFTQNKYYLNNNENLYRANLLSTASTVVDKDPV